MLVADQVNFFKLIGLVGFFHYFVNAQKGYYLPPEDENNNNNGTESTLRLVQVLFRHGDRTNDPNTVYPKDPYRNETYFPFGAGELTNLGKLRIFRLGEYLQDRYRAFIGPTYTPDLVEGLSSQYNRTKSSLSLLLAGLFPPNGNQIWNRALQWQPIPYNYVPLKEDDFFNGAHQPSIKKLLPLTRIRQEFETDHELLDVLETETGWKIDDYWQLMKIYMCLKTEQEWGLELPAWTMRIFPEPLRSGALKFYKIYTSTTELRRVVVGRMLETIVDNMREKVRRTDGTRKIFLYSGHEMNMAFMQIVLGDYDGQIPPYASHLLFELHEINGIYGVKIFYNTDILIPPHPIKLNACDLFCPLEKFISLLEENFPLKS